MAVDKLDTPVEDASKKDSATPYKRSRYTDSEIRSLLTGQDAQVGIKYAGDYFHPKDERMRKARRPYPELCLHRP